MKLITQDVAKSIPELYSGEEIPVAAKRVPLKIFDPGGRLTLYVLEYDGKDTLFGYMVSPLGSDCDEFGYSSLQELSAVRNRFGVKLERDLHWDPETLLVDAVPALKGLKG
jgi:hypothetical protein